MFWVGIYGKVSLVNSYWIVRAGGAVSKEDEGAFFWDLICGLSFEGRFMNSERENEDFGGLLY